MLEEDVISSVRSMMLGRSTRCDILDREQAVAKTWRPRFWKDFAREEPMPPLLQPVMRTDFMVRMQMKKEYNLEL
jgi:hypothetical protein